MYDQEQKKQAITGERSKPIQRALVRNEVTKTTSDYKVKYTGKKSDFSGGGDPGGNGVVGVSSYNASASVAKVYDTGASYDNAVAVGGADREYHQGHMLAKSLGGSGSANNIFKQDGGQNTTGKWPSFERSVESAKGYGDQNAAMTYTVELKGLGGTLQYNKPI